MGKGTKRPKSYYIQNAKRAKKDFDVSVTTKGFLCTCASEERSCVRETYNILNHAADDLYGKEEIETEMPEKKKEDTSKDEDSSSDESVDVDSDLKKEVSKLQETSSNRDKDKPRRFKQVFSGAKNCIFISTTLPEPLDVSVSVMERIIATKEHITKHLIRMIPVQRTCKAYFENMEKMAKELINQYLPQRDVTFCVVFRSRNNNNTVAKETTVIGLAKLFTDHNANNTASYKDAEYVLNVEIIKSTCFLSILTNFFGKYCRYNLVSIADRVTQEDPETEQKEESASERPSEDVRINTEPSNGVQQESTLHVPEENSSKDISSDITA